MCLLFVMYTKQEVLLKQEVSWLQSRNMNPLSLPPTGIEDGTHYMEMTNIDMVPTFREINF
jgi:hypothetical protein